MGGGGGILGSKTELILVSSPLGLKKIASIVIGRIISLTWTPKNSQNEEVDRVRTWVRFFGMIRIKIRDHSDHGARKGAGEFTLGKDSPVPMMHHDPNDLVSLILIRIVPKELTP